MEPSQREYSENNLKSLLKEENGKHRLKRDLEKWSKANSKQPCAACAARNIDCDIEYKFVACQSKECRASTSRCSREDDELYDRIKYLWPDVSRSVFDSFVFVLKLPRPPPPPSKDATAHARELAQTRLLTQEYHSLIKDSNNWRLPTPPTTRMSLPHNFPSSTSSASRRASSASSSPLSARKNKRSVEASLQEAEKRLKSLQTENIRLTDDIAESQRENSNLREQLTELHMQLKEWRNSCECVGLKEQLCMATASYEALLGDFDMQKNQSQLQDAEIRRLEEERNKALSQKLLDSQILQDEKARSEQQRRDNMIEIERVNAKWGKELMTRIAAVNEIRNSLLEEASSLSLENECLREENIDYEEKISSVNDQLANEIIHSTTLGTELEHSKTLCAEMQKQIETERKEHLAIQNESFLLREAKRCLELRCESLENAGAAQIQHSNSLRSQLDALGQRLSDEIASNTSQSNRQLAIVRPSSSSLAVIRTNQDSSNDTVELHARIDNIQHQAANERAQQQAKNDRELAQILGITKSLKHAVAAQNHPDFLIETVRLQVSSLEAMADSKVGMVLPSTV